MTAVPLLWETWSEVCDLLGDVIGTSVRGGYGPGESIVLIDVASGRVLARQGDWIVAEVE